MVRGVAPAKSRTTQQSGGNGMDLKDINYFLAACKTLNFTRAAEACGVAVPTLTRAIKRLEDDLGGQLFRRERHLTHLTDLGRLMQMHFTTIHETTERARMDAARHVKADTRLKIGVISTMPAAHLVAYLRALRDQAEGLELHIWESHCEELASALERSEIDVAIMSLPEYPDRLRASPLYRESYLVAFAAGHRFEEMNAVPLAELDDEPYIKRLHCEFPSNFARLGVAAPYKAVKLRYMSEREDWVQSMVLADLGCTLMPEFLPILPGIQTRRIVDPEVHRTISIVTVAGRPHTPAVKVAVETARRMQWEGVSVDAVG